MKKLLALLLCIVMVFSLAACGGTGGGSEKDDSEEQLQEFYDCVKESQELLDAVADDIYSNWYDCIYKDKFLESIDYAIACALSDHEEDIERIEELDAEIADAFKEVKDGESAELVKDVMSAYSDYYEFVVNVSGSFETFKTNKETLKKELASLLRDLSYEL